MLETQLLNPQEHRLQTAEQAEAFYIKREKKAAPAGWEAFNNKTLFEAYERRAENLPVDLEVRVPIMVVISETRRWKHGQTED